MTKTSVLIFLATVSVLAANEPDKKNDEKRDVSHMNLTEGLALNGYDPVSYFPEGGGVPKEGAKNRTLVHRGVTYRFASDANKTAFEKNPEKYEPAYGGWCAWAVAEKSTKVDPDPKSFVITDGRLFLFYQGFLNDTRAWWIKDEKTLLPKADANWPKMTAKK